MSFIKPTHGLTEWFQDTGIYRVFHSIMPDSLYNLCLTANKAKSKENPVDNRGIYNYSHNMG